MKYYIEANPALLSAEQSDQAIFSQDGKRAFLPIETDDTFVCVLGSREDFKTRGFDLSHVSDWTMEFIFRKIGENLVSKGGYWEDIEYFGEEYKKREDDDSKQATLSYKV